MKNPALAEGIRQRHRSLLPSLGERQLRLWAASEAKAAGYGGISLVARITGFARSTIHAGLAELDSPPVAPDRVRKRGAGRKGHLETRPELLAALDALVEPMSRGDPESPLRWSCKSTRCLARELRFQGYRASHQLVAELLRAAESERRRQHDHPQRDFGQGLPHRLGSSDAEQSGREGGRRGRRELAHPRRDHLRPARRHRAGRDADLKLA